MAIDIKFLWVCYIILPFKLHCCRLVFPWAIRFQFPDHSTVEILVDLLSSIFLIITGKRNNTGKSMAAGKYVSKKCALLTQ